MIAQHSSRVPFRSSNTPGNQNQLMSNNFTSWSELMFNTLQKNNVWIFISDTRKQNGSEINRRAGKLGIRERKWNLLKQAKREDDGIELSVCLIQFLNLCIFFVCFSPSSSTLCGPVQVEVYGTLRIEKWLYKHYKRPFNSQTTLSYGSEPSIALSDGSSNVYRRRQQQRMQTIPLKRVTEIARCLKVQSSRTDSR